MREAAADPAVATVRVTIAPDNEASLATIAGLGFAQVGEQWDDRDGLELIFEADPAILGSGGTPAERTRQDQPNGWNETGSAGV